MTNTSRTLTAWLSIGSTYTYLTALRLENKKKSENLELLIKPFSIRSIMRTQNNIPFPPEKQEKTRYMWRDIERRAQKYALPVPINPIPYPLQNFDLANKVGLVANSEGWYLEYFREAYKGWFLRGLEAGSEQNLRETFKNLGKNFAQVIEKAQEKVIADVYNSNTEEALTKGIFGAPSFSVENEIFWGDDRLEDAIEFLRESENKLSITRADIINSKSKTACDNYIASHKEFIQTREIEYHRRFNKCVQLLGRY